MNRALAWFAGNPVAANLLMAALLVGGLLAAPALRQEILPDVDLDLISVAVPYPGASPEDVEEAVCVRIEEELQGLQGIRRLRSVAREGLGTVTVELRGGEDVSRRLADVRARVDAIDGFPEEAERPVVRQLEMGRQVLSIAVAGDVDEHALKRIGEEVRDELAALPEITEVRLHAVRPYEVSIEVSEEALQRHALSMDDVVGAVRASSLDLPGGTVKARGGEVLLRALGQARGREAFEGIALVSRADGTRLTLGDVARVVDGFAETDQRAFFDGRPAALVEVFRVGDERVLDVAAAAERWVDAARARMPEGIELVVWQNAGDFLDDRLGSMFSNARSGFLLVIVILSLFLRLRLALWVSLGIPTAFLGAVAVLPLLDVSVNWISLLGFIVVLGIVVDDAIVIGENVHTEQRRAGKALEGAIRGAQTLAVPVVFGVLTTVAAFAPMLFLPGSMGKLVRSMPTVVIACLVFSLVEALFVLPAHLGHGRGAQPAPARGSARGWRRVQERVSSGLDDFVAHRYRPWLALALAQRQLVLAAAAALLLVTAGLLAGGWLRFTFQEPVEGDVIAASVSLPLGTPAEATVAAVRRLEEAARAVQAEADASTDDAGGSIFRHVLTSLGEQPMQERSRPMPTARDAAAAGAHLGEVQVEMASPERRHVGTDEMQRRWRERAGEIAGVTELSFRNTMIDVGPAIELELRGDDLDRLRAAAAALRLRLAHYTGVHDVTDSFRGGKQELQFRVQASAETLGLSLADVARQVRQAFHGEEAQTLTRGRDEVKVVVRYPPERRRSLGDVERMRLRTPDGSEVPFPQVAEARLARGFAAIERVDRQRVVTVTAAVDPAVANANEVVADLTARVLPELETAHPGVRWSFEGEQAEQREFLGAMTRGLVVALLAIYALLAVPLRSYAQPLLIMSVIPFGVVGAAWSHLALGYDLSMYSVIGLVALSGVVVNASLVLVDQMNRLAREGVPLERAAVEAGAARLRAIALTSVTTFAGLTPMMLERSLSARFMIPMAIALGFGVLFAAVVTLVLVPCGALAMEDARRALRRWLPGAPAVGDPPSARTSSA